MEIRSNQDSDLAFDVYAVAATTRRTLREVLDLPREVIFDAMLTREDLWLMHDMGVKV